MQRKLLLGVGLALLFILTFVIALLLAFPMDSVRHFTEKTLENNAFQGNQSVEIKDLSVSPLMNVTAKEITVTPRNVKAVPDYMKTPGGEYNGYTCASYVEQLPVTIDELLISPSLIASLKGNYTGTAKIHLAGGEIELSLETISQKPDEEAKEGEKQDEEVQEAPPKRRRNKNAKADEEANGENDENAKDNAKTAKAAKKAKKAPQNLMITATGKGSRISLNEFALVSNKTGMQIYGEMDFDVNTKLHHENNGKNGSKNEIQELAAKVNLINVATCPTRIKLPMAGSGTLTQLIPFINFGDIDIDIELSEKTVKINKFTTSGPDIKMDVTGDFALPKRENGKIKLNISAHIQPAQEWVESNDYEIIYTKCRRNDDGSIDLQLSGFADKTLKMECGEPIPVEKPIIEKKDESESKKKTEVKKESAKKDDPSKSDLKKGKEIKQVPDGAPAEPPLNPVPIKDDNLAPQTDPQQDLSDAPRRGRRGDRPGMGGRSRFGDPPPEGMQRNNRMPRNRGGGRMDMDQLGDTARRDMMRRRRGDAAADQDNN